MKKSSILAHRGLPCSRAKQNSTTALLRAINEGFGLETDLRDYNGIIVISHDPPTSIDMPNSLRWLIQEINSSACKGRIALNIKSDGLAKDISSLLLSHANDTDKYFVFDMSIPDSQPYLKSPINVYSRMSEYESNPEALGSINGVWLDNFTGIFPQVEYAKGLLNQGLHTAIVSSELHGREHLNLWKEIRQSKIYLNPLFELCTDYPLEAANLFCDT